MTGLVQSDRGRSPFMSRSHGIGLPGDPPSGDLWRTVIHAIERDTGVERKCLFRTSFSRLNLFVVDWLDPFAPINRLQRTRKAMVLIILFYRANQLPFCKIFLWLYGSKWDDVASDVMGDFGDSIQRKAHARLASGEVVGSYLPETARLLDPFRARSRQVNDQVPQ